ncbi:HlyD family secretion protein [Noviherbaspirillum denitrificans]|uniref:Hemolysin D n=1 Tax=Noviherbaspirillum denitrificans TaxID=1968433 RepID=A0A254TGU9_9BURK|nr:HlyD family secretion protein [Noviherbaspirillum denitrificans]OWW21755.1 hemolysin D [Noviherbaspirillum denitrificans]
MSDTTTSQDATSVRTRRRRSLRLILLLLIPAIVLLGAGVIYLGGGRYVETENAYIKADKVPVSPEVSGTVKIVLVEENQQVGAGQPLYRLDPSTFETAVAKAEAKLAQVRTDLSATRAGYREKQAEIALARTKSTFALKEQKRQADLVELNFISKAKFDDAKQNVDLAQQQIVALEQDARRIAESLGGNVDAPLEQHPAYRAAMAELQQARFDLARIEVRASMPGIVSKPPKPGQYVGAGSTSMALVVNGNLWVEANFTETDLTNIRPGQPVTVHVDAYPGNKWHGVVDSLSPATGSEFSVIPAQNATGNWVKIAQRVPVRIKIDAAPGQPPLRAGLSTSVAVDTGQRRTLLGLHL